MSWCNEIKFCPFRTRTEVTPVMTMTGKKETTTTELMECLGCDCPAWYEKEEFDPSGGIWITVEKCRRLEK